MVPKMREVSGYEWSEGRQAGSHYCGCQLEVGPQGRPSIIPGGIARGCCGVQGGQSDNRDDASAEMSV